MAHVPPHLRTITTANILAAVTFGLAGALPAQVVPLGSSGGFGVQAGPSSSWTMPGIDITAGAHLVVAGPAGGAGFHRSPAWNSAFVELAWDLDSAAFASTSASSGGATVHELWSARPVEGRFVIT